jgi:hypothetical protein
MAIFIANLALASLNDSRALLDEATAFERLSSGGHLRSQRRTCFTDVPAIQNEKAVKGVT